MFRNRTSWSRPIMRIAVVAASIGFGAAHANAGDHCQVVIHASSAKPTSGTFASYDASVELIASVENERGNWLKDLKPDQHKRRETKTHFIDIVTYTMGKQEFCDQKIQVRLEGFCVSKAVTTNKQRVGASVPFSPVWLPAFNEPSMQREFKAQLC